MESHTIKVVLVEPQPLALRGAQAQLAATEDIEIVGTATSGHGGIELVEDRDPHVAVLALMTADGSGIDMVRTVSAKHPVLVFTAEYEKTLILDCILAGAHGYILKWGPVTLEDAIRRVYDGQIVLDPMTLKAFTEVIRERLSSQLAQRPPLSAREQAVLNLLAEGVNQTEIAQELTLTVATVKSHCRSIYAKLGVRNMVGAVREAMRLGLVEGDLNRRGGSQTSPRGQRAQARPR